MGDIYSWLLETAAVKAYTSTNMLSYANALLMLWDPLFAFSGPVKPGVDHNSWWTARLSARGLMDGLLWDVSYN